MTHGTIEETFEYHIVNIVKAAVFDKELSSFKSGDELQEYLNSHRQNLAVELLNDIETWMGFDDLLRQVQK
jgi:hypothetical protein